MEKKRGKGKRRRGKRGGIKGARREWGEKERYKRGYMVFKKGLKMI